MHAENIIYQDSDVVLEGFYASENITEKKPGVLVFHDWSGKNEFACNKARALAELGYAAFAVDMFGKGKLGKTTEEKSALIQPLLQDRAKLQKRTLLALETLRQQNGVDTKRIGAIGFCFGGLCILDLARTGADFNAAVSFHGLLNAPENIQHETIRAKIFVLHGFDDPMVTPDQVMRFGEEMTHAKANWELTMYGHTMHAFTNPEAHDPAFGTVYNKQANDRSWIAMQNFFNECLK